MPQLSSEKPAVQKHSLHHFITIFPHPLSYYIIYLKDWLYKNQKQSNDAEVDLLEKEVDPKYYLLYQVWKELTYSKTLDTYQFRIMNEEMIDFVKLAYLKRESSFITPRTRIRDFIQILDVKKKNPDKGIRDILSAYKFTVDEEQAYDELD